MGFNIDDYVDVAERIRSFYERFPEGRLTAAIQPYIQEVGGKPFIVYAALAYRAPDDPLPGEGWAWEPIPGPTPYTKDSELMNAETSAWGRAIASLGFATKHLASREEVRNRSGNGPAAKVEQGVREDGSLPAPKAQANSSRPAKSPPTKSVTGSADPWAKAEPWMLQGRDQLAEWGVKFGDIPEIVAYQAPTAIAALFLLARDNEGKQPFDVLVALARPHIKGSGDV